MIITLQTFYEYQCCLCNENECSLYFNIKKMSVLSGIKNKPKMKYNYNNLPLTEKKESLKL